MSNCVDEGRRVPRPCTQPRIGHAEEKPTSSGEAIITISSGRSTGFQFLAVALFVAVWCLALVFVPFLPVPRWLSISFVVFGMPLIRVVATLGPTPHIQVRPSRLEESDR